MSLTFAVGGDHAGFDYKNDLIDFLAERGITVKDYGTFSADSVDYPDFAHPVASAVEKGEQRFGLLLCGSANGVAITANKHQGIRAGLAWNVEVAKLIRQHNDANVICLPVRFISLEEAKACLAAFIETPFEGGRHQGRVGKIACS
ncbi:ribose 5-phosphate isomerase B [Aquirufa nivalisilvae]|uniref:Ribose-5-phosphate isomerase n=1 Tax=Aquirufa nivalisilvae TaxID=2516557 RepID=A0A2S2DUG6_9BACT|nr:ribose 5-phosphate isomerase B [Aquirufa nivalisilvae]AWL09003.1 Ribose-5-phosphate isomerase [Aquirufa nivalisilvae]MCZ2480802.1 ribose 5-phosphate isomerase B [Aquirufa nivalisilvae]MCZ2482118.1 ribose 5-phosphate isomerase B [Aquirufa nivalisilvae]TBH73523.1 ribose 5-phosphate isomerase B [Aquirufa nivalisilvae]